MVTERPLSEVQMLGILPIKGQVSNIWWATSEKRRHGVLPSERMWVSLWPERIFRESEQPCRESFDEHTTYTWEAGSTCSSTFRLARELDHSRVTLDDVDDYPLRIPEPGPINRHDMVHRV